MIIIDFNQVAMSIIVQFKRELQSKTPEELKGIIFHMVLNSLIAYRKKFAKYGKMVVAVDGRNNWRKQIFPHYKGNRKKSRDEDTFDWNEVWKIFDELTDGIKDNFPWVLVKVDEAEGDDVIAVITKHVADSQKTFNWDSDINQDEKVLIVSSDGDFKQLLRFQNVSQFCHNKKSLVKISKTEIKEKMNEHIVRGDSGDGVPNILSADNCLIDGLRQSPISKSRLDEFLKDGFDACKNETEKRNWQRNYTLVSFDCIPDRISEKVLCELNKPQTGSKKLAMDFMLKHKLARLVKDIQDI